MAGLAGLRLSRLEALLKGNVRMLKPTVARVLVISASKNLMIGWFDRHETVGLLWIALAGIAGDSATQVPG
jgi:hypothetical protein